MRENDGENVSGLNSGSPATMSVSKFKWCSNYILVAAPFSPPSFIQILVSSVWRVSGRPALPFRCNLDKHLHAAASLNSPSLKSHQQLYLFYAPLRKLCRRPSLPSCARSFHGPRGPWYFPSSSNGIPWKVTVWLQTRPLPPIKPLTKQDLITAQLLPCSH